MPNLYFNVAVENFRDGDEPIDRGAIRAAILKALKAAGHSLACRGSRKRDRGDTP